MPAKERLLQVLRDNQNGVDGLYQVRRMALSPDGTRILSCDMRGVIKVWDLAGNAEPVILDGHSMDVFTIAFSPDGTRFATGGNDPGIPNSITGVIKMMKS